MTTKSEQKKNDELMDKLVSLCKRRGFIYPSSEIYGGLSSCWDYGPLGAELKRNLKTVWWNAMTHRRDDVEGLDAAIFMHPQVWHTSGHVTEFHDPMVDCKKCKARFRADKLESSRCPLKPSKSPLECGGELTEARQFNLMFKTHMGPVEEEGSVVYLRPETAQGIYVNFQNVLTPSRQKIPFGIAQIGKAFRNEISPGNFVFRTREFEQMEMQFFVEPGTDAEWLERWKAARMDWYAELGLRKEKLRLHQHPQKELAHYAKDAYDIEYEFPFGWKELEGIHNRTDYDLSRHQEHSGKDLSYFDAASNKRFIPYIIETSAGVDRTLLTCLVDAYREEEVRGEKRVVLKLHPQIAPMKAGIFPLVRRDGLPEIAAAIARELRRHMPVFVDDTGSIGRRYRRQDEAGTPFGITVDSQTQQDGTVTVRDRDTMAQERVRDTELAQFLRARIG